MLFVWQNTASGMFLGSGTMTFPHRLISSRFWMNSLALVSSSVKK